APAPRTYGAQPAYGDGAKRTYGDKPAYGDGAKRTYGDKPAYGDGAKRTYGDKPAYDRKPYAPHENREPAPAPVALAVPASQIPEDELPYIIMGRNAVREAIKSGRSIDRILVSTEQDGSLREVVNLARDQNLQIREIDRRQLDELCMPFGHGTKTGNHQGIVAQVPGVEYCELGDILDAAKAKNEPPFVILLDGIEDPHNLGSIIRSAVCAGAHGVVIPKRRSVSVTAAVCKASAGATEYMKVAKVANLAGAMDRLKNDGIWMAGADMTGQPMGGAKLKGALGLVIGGEGAGLSKLIKDKCDFLVSIPLCGEIDSLNAAVAAAILMFEKKRQDT
ncbi:MAG: 23S rRNA (guanosine(2251)-2'-O)-methyltransferase RlmB, partial [Clostridia bacterium]